MSDNSSERPAGEVPPTPPVPETPAATAAQHTPPAGWHVPPRPAPPTAAAGSAFSTGTHPTQPTLPLGDAARGYGDAPGAATPTATPTKRKSGAARVAGLLVAAAVVGGAAGLGGAYAGVSLFQPTATTSTATGPTSVTVNDTDEVNQTTAIAAKVVPSVVTIEATSTAGSGTGSGVILSSDGYVVTNTHVVTLDGATADAAIRVTTADGRVFDAEIVGTDPLYDLAVIKLQDAEGLTPIEFADSSDLNVGDETTAVGAPLGLSNTVTTGIVSALNRSIEIASSAAPDEGDADEDQGEAPPFSFDFGQGEQSGQAAESIKIAVIQTDAAINPGNSGGALVDSEGRLIGVNVAIASAGGSSTTGGNIGVGFAIPSDIVQRVTDELIDNGSATHGLLGANVQSAAYVDDADITGAYIAEVTPGGAAEAAGLQAGDIVTEFNGVPITDSVDLTAQVRALAAGSEVSLTYVRDGQEATAEVTLGELQQ
ncbi:S1C family serine protease [Microbacterium invictum]|uniref:Trypsin-like peptidase domain-containing protein n=1 Tax=Microbacterium invictum TaxID=515415 RepID=A0ABZ0VDZ2_9MICO|nr:trypsin-like peptidase domain-containing protein [Microbacterium invictum]WQB71833.1 trypsin-like peptidase domain-containing protein [Microbacterium invictum]